MSVNVDLLSNCLDIRAKVE